VPGTTGMISDMAKWVCRCGEQLTSSGGIPHPYQWMLTSDQDFESFSGTVEAEDIYRNATQAFRCPSCGRLHIFWRGWDGEPSVYVLEQG
jgi:hypothetical protein